jgi:hypothetical protein
VTDPLRDPRFPDRPQHPDFWRLSDVVLQLDGQATEGDRTIPEIMTGLVDPESLTYVALNRAGLLCQHLGLPESIRPALAATWLDAFAAGVSFEKRGGHRTTEREDH